MSCCLVDSHCHLDFPEFHEREDEFLAAMAGNGVGAALIAGVSLEGASEVIDLAERHDCLFAGVGVHPDSEGGTEPDVATLVRLAGHPKVVAIGETGLDYYRLKGDLEWQRERFRCHIRAARDSGKPLIIHTREAAADTLAILEAEGKGEVRGVFHCFTETIEVAQQAMELGFHISISGIVSFKKAVQVQEVARLVPLDRLLVETDSPYLAPVPHRGKLNHPALVLHVAEAVARLRDMPLEHLALATTANFNRLFGTRVNA